MPNTAAFPCTISAPEAQLASYKMRRAAGGSSSSESAKAMYSPDAAFTAVRRASTSPRFFLCSKNTNGSPCSLNRFAYTLIIRSSSFVPGLPSLTTIVSNSGASVCRNTLSKNRPTSPSVPYTGTQRLISGFCCATRPKRAAQRWKKVILRIISTQSRNRDVTP